jgi:hypothetical protein
VRPDKEFVCFDCADLKATKCKISKHAEFHLWKCRYCCRPAVWFCGGSVHYCSCIHSASILHRVHRPTNRFSVFGLATALTSSPPVCCCLCCLPCFPRRRSLSFASLRGEEVSRSGALSLEDGACSQWPWRRMRVHDWMWGVHGEG